MGIADEAQSILRAANGENHCTTCFHSWLDHSHFSGPCQAVVVTTNMNAITADIQTIQTICPCLGAA